MRVRGAPPLHLTYCLNIHPGESWAENLAAIRDHTLRVRELVAPGTTFGLGLRLSARAAGELASVGRLEKLTTFLRDNDLYVFTINGFPYGAFHGTSVKERVYAPDWRDARRSAYTCRLADILAALVPEGLAGTISTVPCSFAPWITCDDDVRLMAENLALTAAHLEKIRLEQGKDLCVALEPEPDCHVQTTQELVDFLRGPLRAHGARVLRDDFSCAEEVLQRRIGACLDTAHAAVQFESPTASLQLLRAGGVRVGKIQLSAALRLSPTSAGLARLAQFADPVYLHQVRIRSQEGAITGYPDLEPALENACKNESDEWRVHFHVPLFVDACGELGSTGSLLDAEFFDAVREGKIDQLEIETYTFGVLPASLRPPDIVESIAAEYRWVRERLT